MNMKSSRVGCYVFIRTFFFLFKVHCEQNLVNRVFLHLNFLVPLHMCIISKFCIFVSGTSETLTGSYQHKKGGLGGFGTFTVNKQILGGGWGGLPLEKLVHIRRLHMKIAEVAGKCSPD